MDKDLNEYKAYLEKQSSSGKVASYLVVIKKIGGIVNKIDGFNYVPDDFSSIRNLDLLWKIYALVKSEQGKPDGGFFNGSSLSKSYWDSRHGFCSAAIKSFLDFRIETYDGPVPNQSKGDRQDVASFPSIALRVFAEARKGDWIEQGRAVNARLREYFDQFTEQSLSALTKDQIKELFTGTRAPNGSLDLRTMWSVTGQTYGGTIDPKDDAQKIQTIRDYLVRLKHDAAIASTFWADNDPLRPAGFGSSVVTELLMKFHPDEVLMYAKEGCVSLKQLGLVEFDSPNSDTTKRAAEFKIVQAAGTVILSKMHAMNIDKFVKADGTGDGTAVDYLTVNEFLCFVHEHNDLIKEEVMKNEFKPVETTPKPGNRKLKDAVKDDEMMQRLMSALRTKPFAILAGHSGTGKSQLVRRLAYMTCNDEVLAKETEKFNAPGNYCMVQVKPNWHDSTDLLGYYTEMGGGHYHTTEFVEFICKAYAYPNTPFFVCLDEMNLAPVEQYFAEFLSAIESYSDKTKLTDSIINENAPAEEVCGRTKLTESYNHVKEHKLTIPRNLFVVGTVNVDETTCQFSRKVLDRAMTLLMTTVSFESMTKENDPSNEELIDPDGIKFFLDRPTQATLVKGQMDWLTKVQQQVGDTAFAIAYRFANECALYQKAHQKLMGQKDDANDADAQKTAIDHAVLMKLLPRIHGTRAEVEGIFKGRESEPKKDGLIKALGAGQSATMMENILKRGGDYISFWP